MKKSSEKQWHPQSFEPQYFRLPFHSMRKISKDYGQILVDNKILVSILTHRCQCPHGIPKTGGVRGGATHIHKRKLSSEPHVKKRYKLGNHLFHTPVSYIKQNLFLEDSVVQKLRRNSVGKTFKLIKNYIIKCIFFHLYP